MAAPCREFGISRKTGYKIFQRYEQCGLEGLSDRTRRVDRDDTDPESGFPSGLGRNPVDDVAHGAICAGG